MYLCVCIMQMHGWMVGWMDGWTDGGMDIYVYMCVYIYIPRYTWNPAPKSTLSVGFHTKSRSLA